MSNIGKAVVMEHRLKDSKGEDEGRQVCGTERGSFVLKKTKIYSIMIIAILPSSSKSRELRTLNICSLCM